MHSLLHFHIPSHTPCLEILLSHFFRSELYHKISFCVASSAFVMQHFLNGVCRQIFTFLINRNWINCQNIQFMVSSLKALSRTELQTMTEYGRFTKPLSLYSTTSHDKTKYSVQYDKMWFWNKRMYLFILHYTSSQSSDIYAANKAFFSVQCTGTAEIRHSTCFGSV
jgi:hypothetical protein